jgi:hypothetical protein
LMSVKGGESYDAPDERSGYAGRGMLVGK